MIILVCGGRDFGEFFTTKGIKRDPKLVVKERVQLHSTLIEIDPKFIVQGFATGADKMARMWGDKFGVPHTGDKYKAIWRVNGKIDYSAGPRRNKEMLIENPELVVAFDGGKGTNGMCELARKAGIEVKQIPPPSFTL